MWPENEGRPQEGGEHPEEELAAFALNALDDAEYQLVHKHVVECPHCQEVLLGFQETAARLTEAAAETPLPPGLKARVIAGATGREATPAAPMPVADARWSSRRLRRWLTPAAIGALSLLLAVSVGVMALQQREIGELTAAVESERALVSRVAVPAAVSSDRVAVEASRGREARGAEVGVGIAGKEEDPERLTASAIASAPAGFVYPTSDTSANIANRAMETGGSVAASAEQMDLVKQGMAEVIEATVLSAQPETEKVAMSSPMGTEPEAKGVLMVEPNGRRGVLMVSGMPADTYQIWLVRGGDQVLVDRVVVNDDDGAGVKQLELDESIFQYRQVALLPDERHGPSNPTGEQLLSALIMPGPPSPSR